MANYNQKLKTGFNFLILVFTFSFLAFSLVTPASAQIKLAPDCNPTLPPNPTPQQIEQAQKEGKPAQPCDITAFIKWIKDLINVLLAIAIPIGVLFIIYGAFVIITSGGSEDKFKKGKDIITAAVIGVAIALGAWLIVTTIRQILVGKQPLAPGSEIIGPGGLRQIPSDFQGP